jgi:hypothetical protein
MMLLPYARSGGCPGDGYPILLNLFSMNGKVGFECMVDDVRLIGCQLCEASIGGQHSETNRSVIMTLFG